jgi:hypothetical protein
MSIFLFRKYYRSIDLPKDEEDINLYVKKDNTVSGFKDGSSFQVPN